VHNFCLLFRQNKEKLHLRFGITYTEAIPFIDRNVTEIYIHPNFNNSNAQQGFDIALLKLDKSINFQKNIIPVCMPTENDIFTGKQKWQH